jgi:hypothetical protein
MSQPKRFLNNAVKFLFCITCCLTPQLAASAQQPEWTSGNWGIYGGANSDYYTSPETPFDFVILQMTATGDRQRSDCRSGRYALSRHQYRGCASRRYLARHTFVGSPAHHPPAAGHIGSLVPCLNEQSDDGAPSIC